MLSLQTIHSKLNDFYHLQKAGQPIETAPFVQLISEALAVIHQPHKVEDLAPLKKIERLARKLQAHTLDQTATKTAQLAQEVHQVVVHLQSDIQGYLKWKVVQVVEEGLKSTEKYMLESALYYLLGARGFVALRKEIKGEATPEDFLAVIKQKGAHEQAEAIKSYLEEVRSIYTSLTAVLHFELNVFNHLMEHTFAKKGAHSHSMEKLLTTADQLLIRFREITTPLVELDKELVYIHQQVWKNYEQIRHEYLEEGVCLGGTLAYALRRLKKLPDEGICPTPQARFIQLAHDLLTNMIPLEIYPLIMNEYRLQFEQQELLKQLVMGTGKKWFELTAEELEKAGNSSQKNQLLVEKIQAIDAQLDQLPEHPLILKRNQRAVLRVPEKILKNLKCELEPLLGKEGKVVRDAVSVKEFILTELAHLIDACKKEEDSHILLEVDHYFPRTLEGMGARGPPDPEELKDDLEEVAKRIAGPGNSPERIKAIKAHIALNRIQKNSGGDPPPGHAIYLHLAPPYELQDINIPGFRISARNPLEFKASMLVWFLAFPYTKVIRAFRVLSILKPNAKTTR